LSHQRLSSADTRRRATQNKPKKPGGGWSALSDKLEKQPIDYKVFFSLIN
jgi:hypothetical protein